MTDVHESFRRLLERDIVPSVCEGLDKYPFEDREAYAEWLGQTYYYVRHSTRLLCAAAGRFAEADDVAHYRFAAHVSEERRHEALAQRDLLGLGFQLGGGPLGVLELPLTRSMYEVQYCKIDRGDPMDLMGYILVLEMISRARASVIAGRVAGAHGPGVGTFLDVHAHDDPDHVERALRVVDGLTPERVFSVNYSAIQTAQLYLSMLDMLDTTRCDT